MRLDHLQYELGKYRNGKVLAKYQHSPASRRTAIDVVERLKKLRFCQMRKFGYGEPPYVWLTTAGLRFADLPYSYWEPRITTVAHPHDVNRVRIWLEQNQNYQILWWRSERVMMHYEERSHYPDAEVDIVERATGLRLIIAIEVERTQKSAGRIDEILRILASDYSTVWYFVADGAWTGIEKGIARLPDEHRDRVKMKSLSSL